MVPPAGMASRALTIRLSSTCSTCAGIGQHLRHRRRRDRAAAARRCRSGGAPCATRSPTISLRSSATGCSTCLRLNASNWRVSEAARSAACRISSTSAGHRRILLHAVRHQLGVAANRGQQVVEVVGDAAGQPADRLHLLRLAQLILELHAIADVDARSPGSRGWLPNSVTEQNASTWTTLAVLAQAAHRQLHARHALGIEPRQLIDHQRAILLVHERERRTAGRAAPAACSRACRRAFGLT